MKLTPPKPGLDSFREGDIFKYVGIADRLTNLVINIDEPFVLVLDGAWGTGKSTFIMQWMSMLKEERDLPVVRFDAFANDYHQDAFMALAGEILVLAQEKGTDKSTVEKFLNAATKAGRTVLPFVGKAAVRGLSAGVLSSDDLKEAGEGMVSAVESALASSEVLAEMMIKDQLEQTQSDRGTLEAFRTQLSQLSTAVAKATKGDHTEGGNRPLVFIVDELDRCRPAFALDLLERIKHLFSVENVVFVLVANMQQLEAAVRGTYGAETDARTYLDKFINLRTSLPSQSPQASEERSETYIRFLWEQMGLTEGSGNARYDQLVQEALLGLARAHSLSLRDIERVATHVALAYAATSDGTFRVATLLVGLCVMRLVDPPLYEEAKNGTLGWDAASSFLRLSDWSEDNSRETSGHVAWWAYATGGEVPDDRVGEIKDAIDRYHFYSADQLLPALTYFIDDFRVNG